MTGMVEVELPNQLVEILKGYAKGERVGYITVDTETERKVADTYNQRFFDGQMQTYWVKTQEEFKTAFVTAQQEVDILIMGNNAGSDAWDEAGMKQFMLSNTTIPTGSINDWMAPYAMLTLAKSCTGTGRVVGTGGIVNPWRHTSLRYSSRRKQKRPVDRQPRPCRQAWCCLCPVAFEERRHSW